MKKNLIILVAIIGVLITACQKQTAPNLDAQEQQRAQDMQRLDACTKVNFSHGVLLYQNALLLFQCTRWDQDYPHMFQAMKEISADSWNQIIAPVNEAFLENPIRKNKFFKSIHDLDSKGGLDDLSYVIASLNESNFFDSIKEMFTCMDNPQDKDCNNRLDRIPSRKSIKQILHVLDFPPEVVEQNILLWNELSKSLSPKQEELRSEINKFKSLPAVTSLKIQLLDEVFKKTKEGFSNTDREFLANVLVTPGADKETPWIYEWLHDAELGRDKFRDLLEYPALVNPEFASEVRGLRDAYNANFTCTIYKDGNPSANELIQFDFKTHMADYVSVVKDKSYKSFYDFSSSDIVGLKLSTPVCSELERNQYHVNFIKLLTDMSGFLKERKNYDVFKFLVTKTDVPFDINNNFGQNLYLFDLVAGNIFLNTNNISKEISKSTRDFFPVVFDILEKLPASSYIDGGQLAHELLKKDHDPIYKGMADYWLFLNPDEKNFFLNFVDRHFDKDIKYVLLFNFYMKFLEDYRDVRPVFHKAWIDDANQEEMTMLSVQDFVSHMSGKDALADFKKFFSRNQIIKVLEVLSSGQSLADLAKEEMAYRDSTKYILQSKIDKYTISVPYDPNKDDKYDASSVVACMSKFSDINNGFYDLVRNFPSACQKVANDNIAFKLFGWMNSIDESFGHFKPAGSLSSSLLDKQGLLSPYMLNSQMGILKIIDTVIGPYQKSGKGKGLEYLLRSTNEHFNSTGAAPLIEKNIAMINQWQEIRPISNELYRNSLIKTFTRDANFSEGKNVVYRLGKTLEDYGLWVKNGNWKTATERSLGTYDPRFDCTKVINQRITPKPCPTALDVKNMGSDLLYLLSNVWEKNEGSPVASLMTAQQAGSGLEIPLDSPKAKLYRLSLTELFKYLYDTSDRALPINNTAVKYKDEQGRETIETITTLERIETVIREVRFGNNYLGVSYQNHVVGGSDYNKDVIDRKNMLSLCVKIPLIRCGRGMNANDLRMAYNALATYDGLLDANNGRGLESRFQYGDHLKTVQQVLVGSSAKASQAVTFLPLSDAKLLKHNGKVLTDITMLTGFSNGARFLRDRVGRTRSDFNNFINRPDFKRVDRTFLQGFEMKDAGPSAERLLKKISDQHIYNEGIDWLASLDYNQSRLVEDTAARLLVVASFLGSPSLVFEKAGSKEFEERYKSNNIAQLFMGLERLVDYWPTIKKYFPEDVKLIDAIKPINTGLYFLTEKLNSSNDPEKNITYQLVNDLALITQTALFDFLPDPRIYENTAGTYRGFDLVLALLNAPEKYDYTVKTTRENYHYLDVFHKTTSEWFLAVGQNLQILAKEPRVDLTPLRDYLNFTTKNAVCINGETFCEKNYHYDEIATLSKFLQQKSDSGETNFMLVNKKLLVENIDQVIQIVKDIFPAIKIKEIHPPLKI